MPIATVAKRTARGTLLVNTLYIQCIPSCFTVLQGGGGRGGGGGGRETGTGDGGRGTETS